jgi:CHAT domain-containing protein
LVIFDSQRFSQMLRNLISLFLLFAFLAIGFSQLSSTIKGDDFILLAYKKAEKPFVDAEKISQSENYDEIKEERLNRDALILFKQLIGQLRTGEFKSDSLLFHCYIKTGILYHYFDSIQSAKANYALAIQLQKKRAQIPDSFCFRPLIYLGGIFHTENKYDSAQSCYKEAEEISSHYAITLSESERLINTMGALYFESGNYNQAKNYFEKAISAISNRGEAAKMLLTNYKVNLAATLIKLEDYEKAGKIYQNLLPNNINNKISNDILHNTGFIAYKSGKLEEAISFYRKVNYNNKSNIRLNNDMGQAFWDMGKEDSALHYLQLSLSQNEKWNHLQKNVQHGLTFKYFGDFSYQKKSYNESVNYYQNAIVQFYSNFNSTDIYNNPDNFSGVFSYIYLFNVLTAKANAFEKLYQQDKQLKSLDAALSTYRSAFILADYVEKTYDSDEARLFLNKIKYNVHDHPINISLQLYELTKDNKYLEEAYRFDQQNKASILALNVKESEIKSEGGLDDRLFKKESSIKSAITRLSLKAQQLTDSIQLKQISISIRDYEIQLGKVKEKMGELPGYKEEKFAQSIPSILNVQQLLNRNTALLSYHLAKTELVILCIKADKLSYYKQDIDSTFFISVDSLKQALGNFSTGRNIVIDTISSRLYELIIKPVREKIENSERLLVIPDDELNNLPFEVLRDEDGKYLSEKFIIQYQYSTALLRNDKKKTSLNKKLLGMAPFSDAASASFSKLAYSKNEVNSLHGKIFIDSAATKSTFMALANNYGILHLATHTIVNDTMPEKSLIAFYPNVNLPSNESNLYVQEIYNLNLDGTQLVVLSACETGTGKLARGEGLMSLARAFVYAGCPNIVASLWKADDKSTAWIIQRFYYHLNEGKDAAIALQKAKLDYVQSPDIEKRFKTPNYWAHLVLTGVPEPTTHSYFLWWIMGFVILFSIVAIMYIKLRKGSN